MPDDGYMTLERLLAYLNQALRTAGHPSYFQLEQVSGQLVQDSRGTEIKPIVLTHSNTQQILTGQRKSVPKWIWLLSYVVTLQAVAKSAGIPPEGIGTIEEWKRRHDAACAAEPAGKGKLGVEGRRDSTAGDPPCGLSFPLPAPSAGLADSEEDDRLGTLLALVRRAGAPQWWDGYGDVAPEWLAFYLYLESIAMRIRMYAPGLVPCLLQAEEYAHGVVSRHRPHASADEVTRTVELRMHRQRCLEGPEACHLWAVVEESALRDRRVSRRTMRRQLRHLIDIAAQPNVAISVLLAGTDHNAASKEPFSVFRFGGRYLGDVVCIERPDNGMFLYKRKDTAHYTHLMDTLVITTSAQPRDVQDLLWSILKET